MEWEEIKNKALSALKDKNLPETYSEKLDDEIYEIEKQGANVQWSDYVKENRFWDKNTKGLVLPWLLGMTPEDPIDSGIDHIWKYQTDFPDIDIDFLPHARDYIKKYAAEKYVHTCSVGNWITYKPKSALQDVIRATGGDLYEMIKLTKSLPDEFDECSLDDLRKWQEDAENKSLPSSVRQEAHKEVSRYAPFYKYWEKEPEIVDISFRLVGKIKAQGTHAGGVIIADRPLDDLIPLSLMGKKGSKSWTSQWTEGRSTQLSKFGLIKFDILGLKTMQYVWLAGEHVRKNKGIIIDWSHSDPTINRAGEERHPDGSVKVISLSDEKALKLCNDLKTESVFQVETDIQKGIISDGVVNDFWDLVVYNALGRPGPMEMIPEYIRRRDEDPDGWKKGQDSRIIKALEDTYGVICYQEQLTQIWTEIAKFTVPEAEASRKVIAKKWADKLPGVQKRWMEGASKEIGEKAAADWWLLMVDFGRYAFNKAHSVAYSLITYMCLYMKANYPPEWWAAAMSSCHPDKLPLYMSAAKKDNVEFGNLEFDNMTLDFSVSGEKVTPGLSSIKGIGKSVGERFVDLDISVSDYSSIDEFIEKHGKHKSVFERIIKLGAFDKLHSNRNALWHYFVFYHCRDAGTRDLRNQIKEWFEIPEDELARIRAKKIAEYKEWYPKRKKIPKKVSEYKPKISPTYHDLCERVENFTMREQLDIEKQYLGYYWNSPLSVYKTRGYTIQKIIDYAKEYGEKAHSADVEVVVERMEQRKSNKGNIYYVLHGNDGIQTAQIFVWSDYYANQRQDLFDDGRGLRLMVIYNLSRKSFTIDTSARIIPLVRSDSDDSELDVTNEELSVVSKEDYPLW